MAKQEKDMSSVKCMNGRCRIRCIDCNDELRKHIQTMGLVPGTAVDVICNDRNGCILEVRGSRLAVGNDLAGVLMVEPA